MSAKKLLVITGAGASRHLGTDNRPLPLMGDLAEAFRITLRKIDKRLPESLGIEHANTGPDFEGALGEYFQWRGTLGLARKFWGLRIDSLDRSTVTPERSVQDALEQQRIAQIDDALNRVLFQEFGVTRIDEKLAIASYKWLLYELQVQGEDLFAFATTNYDLSLEMACDELFGGHDIGAPHRIGRERIMSAEGIALWSQHPAVLHLHGAVGWYRVGHAEIEVHGTERGPESERGVPAMLYPNPNKDPTAAATAAIWAKLHETIEEATHVIVLGHSLHDQPLVDSLNDAPSQTSVAVVYYMAPGDLPSEAEAERIQTLLPRALPVAGRFGPQGILERPVIAKWLAKGLAAT